MIRHLFLASTALLAAPAFAQSTVPGRPADLPAFIEQPFNLPGPGQVDILGDGTGLWGGTPPAYATMPANIPTPNAASLYSTGDANSCGGGPTDPNRCGFPGWREPEPKLRLTLSTCYLISRDDPVVYPRRPDFTHPHQFLNNCGLTSGSTYQSLRNFKNGRSKFGDIIRTAYWPPLTTLTNHLGDGRTYGLWINPSQLYYQCHNVTECRKSVFLPVGFRTLWGMHMDDPEDRWIKAKISAGNALNQAAYPGGIYNPTTNTFSPGGRYQYRTNGFDGYKCTTNRDGVIHTSVNGNFLYPALATETGQNPWPTCTGTGTFDIEMELSGPDCWDRVNVWGGSQSPRRAARHTYHSVKDNAQGGKHICFNGHARIMWVKMKTHVTFSTAEQWTQAGLSSDAMAQAKLNADYAAAGLTPPTLRKGESAHGDVFIAADDVEFRNMQRNLGIMGGVDGDSNPDKILEMNDATVSATRRLIMPPIVSRPTGTLSGSTMVRVPLKWKGGAKATGHHVM